MVIDCCRDKPIFSRLGHPRWHHWQLIPNWGKKLNWKWKLGSISWLVLKPFPKNLSVEKSVSNTLSMEGFLTDIHWIMLNLNRRFIRRSQISLCWMWIHICEIKKKTFSNFGLGINLPSASQCLKAPRKKRKISPSMRFPPKFWRQKSRVRLYAHWAGVTLRVRVYIASCIITVAQNLLRRIFDKIIRIILFLEIWRANSSRNDVVVFILIFQVMSTILN